MFTSIDGQPVIDEETWRAWLQKGRLREEATARKSKVVAVVAAVALVLLAVLSAVYFLAVK